MPSAVSKTGLFCDILQKHYPYAKWEWKEPVGRKWLKRLQGKILLRQWCLEIEWKEMRLRAQTWNSTLKGRDGLTLETRWGNVDVRRQSMQHSLARFLSHSHLPQVGHIIGSVIWWSSGRQEFEQGWQKNADSKINK